MDLDISWERKDGVLIAVVAGRIDGNNADVLQDTLEFGIGPEDRALILDFERVTFISSAGLRVGVIIAWKFKDPGMQFGVCTLADPVRHVITVSGFDQIIDIFESQAEAIETFRCN
ncbi:MAG: STAS domain-containing protein [Gemmatimonadetes bacterium]|nr:STAS domain-containing protein [Gemmatimonadota bacterium]MDE3258833.1 STAS domain-containing protein [Gemmatimonadota bacterium]